MKLGKPPFWVWSPLVLGFIVAMLLITIVSAQTFSLPPTTIQIPRTAPWTDGKGETVGTATFSGNRMYLRDLDGKHIVTVVTDATGVTMYDPNGKVLDHKAAPTK